MVSNYKAYILGLFVGGGTISEDTFEIVLPLDKWGVDPTKMGAIARHILTKANEWFRSEYGISINYVIANQIWKIIPIERCELKQIKSDLKKLSLPTTGFLLKTADLEVCKSSLRGIQQEYFLSGIFDARASLTASHRRFTSKAPVVSIEVPGSTQNYRFVVQLCSWMTSLGSVTDQILYNHPTQHSAADPTYKNWRKGFKIRLLAASFLANHSFAMQAKSIDASKLKAAQENREQPPCIDRKSIGGEVSIHDSLSAPDLPMEVRGKLFFHYHHICAVMGCPYAPIGEVKKMVDQASKLVNLFPRLLKGSASETRRMYNDIFRKYFSSKSIVSQTVTCEEVQRRYAGKIKTEQALAFLFSKKLAGKRHSGAQSIILSESAQRPVQIDYIADELAAPVMLTNPANGRAAIVSSVDPTMNEAVLKIEGFDVTVRRSDAGV